MPEDFKRLIFNGCSLSSSGSMATGSKSGQMVRPSGQAIWSGHMVRPLGQARWSGHMVRPFGQAKWSGRGELSRERFDAGRGANPCPAYIPADHGDAVGSIDSPSSKGWSRCLNPKTPSQEEA